MSESVTIQSESPAVNGEARGTKFDPKEEPRCWSGKERQPKILVLTLFAGENEFEHCKESVTLQRDVDVDHVVFAGMGNVAAHRALYEEIMRRVSDFDLFIKLDADMVLNHQRALAEVAAFFEQRPTLDHLVVEVNDHFTGKPIIGVHIFSKRVRWELEKSDKLFVDPRPKIPGERILRPEEIGVFVEHAPDPSPYQAFHFGFHRALKVKQQGRWMKKYRQVYEQAQNIRDLETHFLRTFRPVLGYALLGATMLLRRELHATTGDKQNASVAKSFDHLQQLSADEIRQEVARTAPKRASALRQAELTALISDRLIAPLVRRIMRRKGQ